MGRQTNIKLRGTVENIIFYQWKGIHCIRTKPAHVKRVPVAIKNSGIFGMSVKSSAVLRRLLKSLLPDPRDRKMMHSLDGAFRQWLNTEPLACTEPVDDIPAFNGFSFNLKKGLDWYLKVDISTSRTDNKE